MQVVPVFVVYPPLQCHPLRCILEPPMLLLVHLHAWHDHGGEYAVALYMMDDIQRWEGATTKYMVVPFTYVAGQVTYVT